MSDSDERTELHGKRLGEWRSRGPGSPAMGKTLAKTEFRARRSFLVEVGKEVLHKAGLEFGR